MFIVAARFAISASESQLARLLEYPEALSERPARGFFPIYISRLGSP